MENNFIESIIVKDKQLLVYLNSFGNEQWDGFWLYITDQFHWIPLFIIILIIMYLKFGIKKIFLVLLFIAAMIAFSDQLTNFMKNLTGRLRPCNEPEIRSLIRVFSYRPRGFSFWSGHAGVSTIFTTFTILLFRKEYKLIYLMILFPMIFGYSRIYLGVHYPIDVTSGYIVGICVGFLFYKLFKYSYKKVFKEPLEMV